jgi:hypothetical protein
MMSGPLLRSTLILIAAATASGCAQTGDIFPRRTTVGTLKTSVSQLEFENEKLRREVAKLNTENRQIENELVDVEAARDELTTCLDDARHELRKRGLDFDGDRANARNSTEDPIDEPTTRPAGRSNRTKRKPPFAQIPSRIDEPDTSDGPADTPKADSIFGPQGSRDEIQWLPIARGTSDGSKDVR